MAKNKQKSKKDIDWARAKKMCRLNMEDIQMAKEMGFKPKSLIKNIPSKSQQWKLPVKQWIRELYLEKQEKATKKKRRKEQASTPPSQEIVPTENSKTGLLDPDF